MGMSGTSSAMIPFPGTGISLHSCSYQILILQGNRKDALKRGLSHVILRKEEFPLLEEFASSWVSFGFAFPNFQEYRHPHPTGLDSQGSQWNMVRAPLTQGGTLG